MYYQTQFFIIDVPDLQDQQPDALMIRDFTPDRPEAHLSTYCTYMSFYKIYVNELLASEGCNFSHNQDMAKVGISYCSLAPRLPFGVYVIYLHPFITCNYQVNQVITMISSHIYKISSITSLVSLLLVIELLVDKYGSVTYLEYGLKTR
jgi:hypothetical protein